MRKFFAFVAGIILIIGGFIIINWNVPTWRLYDGNWKPLAMTQAENWCAGKVLGDNGFNNKQDDPDVDACVAASKMDNTTPNIALSVEWACRGVNAAFPDFPVEDCKVQVEGGDIWFLQHGGYTWEWNSGNKRPVASHSDIRQPPRGERDSDERTDNEERALG
jgi:hypothetical protein